MTPVREESYLLAIFFMHRKNYLQLIKTVPYTLTLLQNYCACSLLCTNLLLSLQTL